MHSAQVVSPDAFAYWPGEQATHADAPETFTNNPGVHVMHTVPLVDDWYFPAWQEEQAVEPAVSEYVPTVQYWQEMPPIPCVDE
jgi:hypothetical protein